MSTVVIAKNVTVSPINLIDLGITIGAGQSLTLTDQFEVTEVTESNDLHNAVLAGSIVINDGTQDLSAQEGADFVEIELRTKAALTSTDTSNFSDVLGPADENVQLALDTIDQNWSTKADVGHGHSHSTITDDQPERHRVINDGVITPTDLWSAAKIDGELGGKADTGHGHSHSELTNDEPEKHRIINDAGSATDELWSADKIETELAGKSDIGHNHNLADLTEKSYLSLTDKPVIPSNHSQLTDDEVEKHRVINDSVITTTDLWSSDKISTEVDARIQAVVDAAPAALDTLNEIATSLANDPDFAGTITTALAGKSDIGHSHNLADLTEKSYLSLTDTPAIPTVHSDLTDDEPQKHRQINDAASNSNELWSADKIDTELSGKADVGHAHDHSQLNDDEPEKHRVIDDATITTNKLWSSYKIDGELGGKADVAHNHNLADLDERSYASLTNKPSHSQITNDEVHKHREIGDTTISPIVLWSSDKIATELSLKAPVSHNHTLSGLSEKSYNSLTDKPAIPASHSDLTDDEVEKHRVINDAAISTNELWSSSKINTELSGKSNIGHGHNLADLTERSYTSLTDKPDIPDTHSDLTDDEPHKHRIINDTGVGNDDLWSANKINTELSGKADTVHNHLHSEVSDDEPQKHREIDDATTSSIGLWSSSKTNAELLGKADVAHNHNLADLDEKSYDSLTDKPSHSQITDDEPDKHREIDDAGMSGVGLWSSNKITTELAGKADAGHNHTLTGLSEKSYNSLTDKPVIPVAHSDLTDDEVEKHRVIDDLSTASDVLWSAAKIGTGLAGKADAGHNHTLAGLSEKSYNSLTDTPVVPVLHSDLTDDEIEKHRVIDDVGITLNSLWSSSKINSELSLKSNANHNHNLADLDEKSYNSLTDAPAIPAAHSDLTDDEPHKHRQINDASLNTDELWSAAKISSELSGKSDTSHLHYHSQILEDEPEKHRLINDLGTSVEELWSANKIDSEIDSRIQTVIGNAPELLDTLNEIAAALGDDPNFAGTITTELANKADINHNHNLADLTEKSYLSLTDKPAIPAAHSDLTDDEAEKHRVINDLAANTTELWSASKISTELAGKSNTTHTHTLAGLSEKSYLSLTDTPAIPAVHSDLTDDEVEKHRIINDFATNSFELWSADKISTELAGKSDTAHNHNLADLTEKSYLSLTDTPVIPGVHSDLTDDEVEKHRVINDLSGGVTDLWSADKIQTELDGKSDTTHNHDLADLTERSYNSLTDTPFIPTAHSDLTDDEVEKHRVIDDAIADTDKLWSSDKIAAELAGKADVGTAYNHSDIVDDEPEKHRIIDDVSAASPTTLWSSSKIETGLAGKAAAGHNHNLADLMEKSYLSLTDKPSHSQITDDEVEKHRIINDTAASPTELWSAYKTNLELSVKSPIGHTHNLADLSEKSYNSLDDKPFIPAAHSDITDDEEHKHRVINDAATNTNELWSADKISTELAGKSAVGHAHDHSQITDDEPEKHRIIDDFSVSTTSLWSSDKIESRIQVVLGSVPAALDTLAELADALNDDPNFAATMTNALAGKADISHNHNLADLTEKSYLSLTDTPVLPDAHSDLTDDEVEKHRIINDLAANTDELWSANKISTELGNKADVSHGHVHSQITDDEIEKHREINDIGITAIDLWSAEKIGNELAGKSDTLHNHALSSLTEKSYASLDNKPNHSDIPDDEPQKHRIINDTATNTDELWSADKINTELAGKSDITHNHSLVNLTEKSYNSLTDKPVIPGVHSDLTDDEPQKHRVINDAATNTNELWSAYKINSELNALSLASHGHDHSEINDDEPEKHRIIDDAGAASPTTLWSSSKIDAEVDARIDAVLGAAPAALDTLAEIADSLNNDPDFAGTITTALANKADINHNHHLSLLTERSYNSLTDKPVIPANHSDLVDNEPEKHRIIDDLSTDADKLWSGDKISMELGGKSDVGHTHHHGTLIDDEPEKHRIIDDLSISLTELWSSFRINQLLDQKSDTGHTHNHSEVTDDEPEKHRIIDDLGVSSTDLWSADKIITTLGGYSLVAHNHNLADLTEKSYLSLTDKPSHSQITDDEIEKHRIINDLAANTDELWSADKISTELAGKSDTTHNHNHNLSDLTERSYSSLTDTPVIPVTHSDLTDDEVEKHRVINDLSGGVTDLWSADKIQTELDGKSDSTHNHNLADLTEKSYLSLTDKPSHSQITDDEPEKHRVINDTGTGTTDLWSAAKINAEIADSTNHSHSHSQITDDEVEKHREINDVGIGSTDLWSAHKIDSEIDSRIQTVIGAAPGVLDTLDELAAALNDDPNFATTVTAQLANKADIGHNHNLADLDEKSYLSLTDKPSHSDIVDDQPERHRVIDDLGTVPTALWSSLKISTELAGKAGVGHNHNLADLTEKSYLSLTDKPSHSQIVDDEVEKHRIINDAGTSTTALWSSSKIASEIADSTTHVHVHSQVTDDEPEKHRIVDDAAVSTLTIWSSDKISSELSGKSDTTHNHNLADLAERSYSSLTNKPHHSAIPDDEPEKHRIINDAGTSTTALWSSTKIQGELDGKSDTTHNHNLADLVERSYNSLTDKPSHSQITDDEPEKHRIIDDVGTSLTTLWSSSKVNTELAGKSDAGHTHHHSNIIDDQPERHRIIDDLGAELDELWSSFKISHMFDHTAPLVHTHNHSQITDDEPEKHRIIDDTGSSTTSLWSSAKIEFEINDAATYYHSEIIDDEQFKHRTIQDGATGTTSLWSSYKISNTIDERIQEVVGAAPLALDTLVELADSLANDPDFAGTMTTALANKADINHNHNLADLTERSYNSLTDKPDIPDTHSDLTDDEPHKHRVIDDLGTSSIVLWSAEKIIAELADGTTHVHPHSDINDDEPEKHRVIDDLGTGLTDLWSANKIITTLGGYSLVTHNHNLADLTEKSYLSLTDKPSHSQINDDEPEKHREIDDSGTSATSLWSSDKISTELAGKSDIAHNHNLADLDEKSYTSLTDKPSHSDINDDEPQKHRVINDTNTSLIELWSSDKIAAEIADGTNHVHNHSEINDDEPHKHRQINDSGATSVDLWSAFKITNELAGKSDITHNHNLADLDEKSYLSLTDKPNHSDIVDDEPEKHRIIDDLTTSTTSLWSSNKIWTLISDGTNHNHAHSDLTDDEPEKHRLIDDALVTTITMWSGSKISGELAGKADVGHNHNLADLTERSYNSLTDKPSHSDIVDDEPEKHRIIDDIGTSTTTLWSSTKIWNEITDSSNHSHNHSDIIDNEVEKHRVIDDALVSTIKLWSSNKIQFELDGKSDVGHTHLSSDITDAGTVITYNVGTGSGQIPVLDGAGKLPESVLPSLSITETHSVATIAARNALVVQEGDVAIVDDDGSGVPRSYIFDGTNWKELKTPDCGVTSVNGYNGTVILDTDDIDEGSLNLYFTVARAVTAIGGSVNDSGITTSDIWSASKILNMLGGYSPSSHNHNLADLDEKSYNSLTDKPFIPGTHSDLTDDEPGKHRVINDLGTSTIELWSSDKIQSELDNLANSAHNHNHSDITDDEPEKHRIIDDLDTSPIELWSSAKISTELANKANAAHNHNLADLAEKSYNSLTDKPVIPSDHSDLTGIGSYTHAQIDAHINNTNNPHNVNAGDVGNTVAQWNANQINGLDVVGTPTDGQVPQYNNTSGDTALSD